MQDKFYLNHKHRGNDWILMIDDKCLLGDTKTKIFKTRHLKKISQENVKLL